MISRKFVKCKICFRKLKQITDFHLKPKHNISILEYKTMFPNTNTVSVDVLNKLRRASSGRKHSEEVKKRMSFSRKKYLKNNEFIPPVLLMNNEEKQEWKDKVSTSVTETMKDSEVLKRMVENRNYEEPWNKGLTKDTDIRIKKATEKRAQTLSETPKNKIFVSKIEIAFLDEIEQVIGNRIKRQHRIKVDGTVRNVDGFMDTYLSKIIIEVDGVYWHSLQDRKNKDIWLNDFCSRNSIQIFRFNDIELYDSKTRKECVKQVTDYYFGCFSFYERRENIYGGCLCEM